MGNNSPDLPMHQEMQDTPWISQLRDISQHGGQGVLDNYNRVNVFSEPTQQELRSQVNNVYNRAETDFDRNYRDTMQKLANRNYAQFGTLNATPAAYRTDLQNLSEQRKLADLAYDKALYADKVKDAELQRRYKTLDMFNNMLAQGQIPYNQDLKNWGVRNENIDRGYYNDLGNSQSNNQWGTLGGAIAGAALGTALGNPMLGAQLGSMAGGTLIH